MSILNAEYGDFFERRGRKGFAEDAKDEKEYKIKSGSVISLSQHKFSKIPQSIQSLQTHIIVFGVTLVFSFLRSLRVLCALCVQKISCSSYLVTLQFGESK